MRLLKRYLMHLASAKASIHKEMLLNMLEENKTAKVLDIGCNNGSFTREVAKRLGVKQIFGIEFVREYAEEASKDNDINAVMADAERPFPFRDGCFDLVVSNQLIEHLGNTDNFIREVYRVLKPGGVALVSTGNLANLHDLFSLILGYQPPSLAVSDEVVCGNPFNPDNGRVYTPPIERQHRRLFTSPALKGLFEFHGFKCEKLMGWGLHPLPLFLQKHIRIARYSVYLTIKARKPHQKEAIE